MSIPVRRALAAVTVVLVGIAGLAFTATPAAAASATIEFEGYGYGHGRGMSQWGSQGYADRYGWSSAKILNHYYGGTTGATSASASSRPVSPTAIRVRMERLSGRSARLTITDGRLRVNGTATGMRSVEIRRAGNGKLEYRTAHGCANLPGQPWTSTSSTSIPVTKYDSGPSSSWEGLIAVCPTPSKYSLFDGVPIWYPGSFRVHIVNGTTETTNILNVENQLRSVVPRESPAYWHLEALKAQAVAARSYALSGDGRWGSYADTCDTISCQVYAGWWWRRPGATHEATFHSRTDTAINATHDVVRLNGASRIARTEFSASSGGYTAGGTFPAVKDDGDLAVSPHLGWRTTVSAAPLESAYGGGSRLTGISVTKRNGLGAIGGRAIDVRLSFANGTSTTVAGNTIRSRLGLRSDWFRIIGGDFASPAQTYITAVYQLFLGRNPSSAAIDRWTPVVQSGRYSELTSALSVSDEWAGVEIDNLYRKILGRPSDSSGRAYWLDRVRSGLKIEEIAAYFYGGPEYFERKGSTNSKFVTGLYHDILGRPPDSGHAYWVDQLNRGNLTRSGVAAGFYASIESRRQRVNRLYQVILGRRPDVSGREYWADQLPKIGDVSLAAYLAASGEYYRRVTS